MNAGLVQVFGMTEKNTLLGVSAYRGAERYLQQMYYFVLNKTNMFNFCFLYRCYLILFYLSAFETLLVVFQVIICLSTFF